MQGLRARSPISGLSIIGLLAISAIQGACDRASAPSESLARRRNEARLQLAAGTREGEKRAVEIYSELLHGRDSGPVDWLNLVRVLLRNGDEKAADEASRLLDLIAASPYLDKPAPAVDYLAGLAALRLGRTEAALESFEAVVAVDPDCASAWYQLGLLALAARRPDEAIRRFTRVTELDPGELGVAALYQSAQAHGLAGRSAGARRLLGEFETRRAGRSGAAPDPATLDSCGYTEVEVEPPSRRGVEPREPRLAFQPARLAVAAGSRVVAAIDADGDGDAEVVTWRDARVEIVSPELSSGRDNPAGRSPAGTSREVFRLPGALWAGHVAAWLEPTEATGDGQLDFLVVATDGSMLLVSRSGNGGPTRASAIGVGDPPALPLDAGWSDLDLDGDVDLVLLVERSEEGERTWSTRVLLNDGAGRFRPQGTGDGEPSDPMSESVVAASGPAAARAGLVVGDLDGEPGPDVALPGRRNVVLYLGQRFGPARRETVPGLQGHRCLLAGDLDNDGDIDLAGLPGDGVPFRVAWNLGAGRSSPARFRVASFSSVPQRPVADAALVDLDNDGDLDLVIRALNGETELVRNRDGGRFALQSLEGLSAGRGLADLHIADLDGDGLLDIILAHHDAGPDAGARAFLARATPRYAAVSLRLSGEVGNRFALGARVELYGARAFVLRELRRPEAVRFGLGCTDAAEASLDGFRIVWPDGKEQAVLRHEIRWDARRQLEVPRY